MIPQRVTVPEAMRMIAGWVEDERSIQQGYKPPRFAKWLDMPNPQRTAYQNQPAHGYINIAEYIYRAKPEKPRVIKAYPHGTTLINPNSDYVEVTPEVRALLEKEGLL